MVLRAGPLVSVRPPLRVRTATFAQAGLHVPVTVRGRGAAQQTTIAMGLRASLGRRVRPRRGAKRVSTAIRVAELASPREGLVPVAAAALNVRAVSARMVSAATANAMEPAWRAIRLELAVRSQVERTTSVP